jgi:hypothetical protein
MLRLSIGGLVMAVLHLALLSFTVLRIVHADVQQWPLYWTTFLALDFPLSLGVLPLTLMFPASSAGPLHDFPNFWWPLGFHGVVGTVWWYIVGAYIGRRIIALREQGRRRHH